MKCFFQPHPYPQNKKKEETEGGHVDQEGQEHGRRDVDALRVDDNGMNRPPHPDGKERDRDVYETDDSKDRCNV